MTEELFWHGGGITPVELLAEVDRLKQEFPDRVGTSGKVGCVYTEYETTSDYALPVKPVCIIGTAVYNLSGKFVGPELEGSLIGINIWAEALGAGQVDEVGDVCEFSDEEQQEAFRACLDVQIKQDNGVPWGEC